MSGSADFRINEYQRYPAMKVLEARINRGWQVQSRPSLAGRKQSEWCKCTNEYGRLEFMECSNWWWPCTWCDW